MDTPSGSQNELKDSLPVIVSDIAMDASSALHNELKLLFLSHCRVLLDASLGLQSDLKDSLSCVVSDVVVFMKQDTAQDVSCREVVMEASPGLQSELRDSLTGIRVMLTLSHAADSLPNELKGTRKRVGSVALSVLQSVECDTTGFRLPLWPAQIVSPRNFGSGLPPLGGARLHWRIFGLVDTGRVFLHRIQTNAAPRCSSPLGSPGTREPGVAEHTTVC